MIDYLQHLSAREWLALTTLLLVLEVFGAGGYLLWIGLAAAAVSLLTYFIPELAWGWQLCLFAALATLAATFWWHRQRHAITSN